MTNTAKVLIVDGNERNRKVLNDSIVALGYTPILAENGLTALAKMKEQSMDMILLDILMPKMDGFGVLNI